MPKNLKYATLKALHTDEGSPAASLGSAVGAASMSVYRLSSSKRGVVLNWECASDDFVSQMAVHVKGRP